MKKSQIQSRTVIYILAVIIILILLIAFIIFIKSLKEKQRRVLLEKLSRDLEETVQTIDFGAKQEKCLELPDPGEVCFFDLSKRETILKSPLINRYSIIRDTIESGVVRNLFIISKGNVESFYIGEVCMEHYPYFNCIEVPEKQLCIFLEGRGRCALLLQDLRLCYKPQLSPDDKIKEDFILGSSYARLLFKKDATLTYPTTEKELCIEPVYFQAESLLSEVYNLTPIETAISPNAELTMRYFTELLKNKDDIENIKIKQFDTATNSWSVVHNIQNSIDQKKKSLKENINKLSYVAIFGSETPSAVIKLSSALSATELKKSLGGIYIVGQSELIEFDASASSDPDSDIASYDWNFGDSYIASGIKSIHSYTSIGSYVATLTVTDKKGNKGSAKATIHISAVGNVKNQAKYASAPIFLVDDAADNNNILRLIPLAMWDGFLGPSLGVYNYPLLVYHKEASSINAYNLNVLKQKYSLPADSPIIAFGNIPSELSGSVLSQSFDTDYFTYWSSYNEIVLVSQNNLDVGLPSALYASFLNAPLFFVPDTISSSNKDQYCPKITGKTAYLVESNIDISICSPQAVLKKSLAELRDAKVNPYTRLHGNFMPAGMVS